MEWISCCKALCWCLLEFSTGEERWCRASQEELQKGHFDDFKQLRDTQGKLFRGTSSLIPKKNSKVFPSIVPVRCGGAQDGGDVAFPPIDESNDSISLVYLSFRDGARPMVDTWKREMDKALVDVESKMIKVVEISLIESYLMSLWPFRSMLMANVAKKQIEKGDISTEKLFLFRDIEALQQSLELPNRLIGYVLLLDCDNLIRWRGCGFPDEKEIESLASCARKLLENGPSK